MPRPWAAASRSSRLKEPDAEPHAYTAGRDGEVDAAIAACGLRLPERPLWWEVVDIDPAALRAVGRRGRLSKTADATKIEVLDDCAL